MRLTFERPIVVRAALLLLGGSLVGFGVHTLRPGALSLAAFQPPTACHGPEEGGLPEFIEPDEATSLCGQPDVTFADARPATQYAEGHIADALHVPCEGSVSIAPAVGRRLEGSRLVVVYGQTSEEGAVTAEALRRRHPGASVRALRGGFAAWEARGFACAAGPCVECMASGPAGSKP
jgi:rhodanese-related sulfurtransferase